MQCPTSFSQEPRHKTLSLDPLRHRLSAGFRAAALQPGSYVCHPDATPQVPLAETSQQL
jgi:hypothetical protein